MKFNSLFTTQFIQASSVLIIASNCQFQVLGLIQNYILTEPTNNIAPKLPGEKYEGGRIVTYHQSSTAYLMCQVVGYPVPRYRYCLVLQWFYRFMLYFHNYIKRSILIYSGFNYLQLLTVVIFELLLI